MTLDFTRMQMIKEEMAKYHHIQLVCNYPKYHPSKYEH